MSQPDQTSAQPSASDVGDGLFWIVTVICTLVPGIAYELVPGGDVSDKATTFWTVYFTTLPLSLALTAIGLVWMRGAFDSDQERLWGSAAIILVSGVVGLGFGSSVADQEFLSQVHGDVRHIVGQIVAYILFSYATFYGVVLYIAAIGASIFAAYWINEKLGPPAP